MSSEEALTLLLLLYEAKWFKMATQDSITRKATYRIEIIQRIHDF